MGETEDLTVSYDRLKNYLQLHDPIKLLSQLSLTLLCGPADQRPDSSRDAMQWERWV